MPATAVPAPTDRSDARTVLTGGTKLGLLMAAAVVLYLIAARYLPGALRGGMESVLVLAGGVAAAVLPGQWCAARNVEGIAGAAALGLWGTIVFSVIDVGLLRPLKAYPWTWDAFGGGTTWWYLPMWWILGTFLAWMGGILTAARGARGPERLARAAAPMVVGGVVVAAVAGLAALPVALPVAAGVGFGVTLAALALVSLARRA